jgi:hypothetical protein
MAGHTLIFTIKVYLKIDNPLKLIKELKIILLTFTSMPYLKLPSTYHFTGVDRSLLISSV